MPLSELELIGKYCKALQIKTFEDLRDFIKAKNCKTNADLKEALIQEYVEVFENADERPQEAKSKVEPIILKWEKSETAQGTNYQLIEGGALRTYWHIVKSISRYVIYFRNVPIKAMDTIDEAKAKCEALFILLY